MNRSNPESKRRPKPNPSTPAPRMAGRTPEIDGFWDRLTRSSSRRETQNRQWPQQAPTTTSTAPRPRRALRANRNRAANRQNGRTDISRPPGLTEVDPFQLDISNPNPVLQRQWNTQNAMRNLRSPPHQAIPTWTPQHHDVLSANIKLLLDATKDPSERAESASPENDYEGQRRAQGQSTDPNQRAALRKTNPRRQKRQREEEEEEGDGDTVASSLPLKKLRTGANRKTQEKSKDLTILKPQPLQFEFPPHPPGDRSDDWFIEEFRKLFRRLERFVSDYFCIHDLHQLEYHQPWLVNNAPEFLAYVEHIAEADPGTGSWDQLLTDPSQRKWLLMGVLMQILQVKVFNVDLWGAAKIEKELLLDLDRAFFTQEGFSRTNLRSQTVRTIIGSESITANFQSEVARLTAQVCILLKPLSDYLYSTPQLEGVATPLIWDQCQSLHNLISSAAYLSICIRLSPTIFYFSDVSPNEPYNPDEQHSVDPDVYVNSKKVVIDDYLAARASYLATQTALEKVVTDLTTANKINTRAGRKAQARLAAHLPTQPRPPGQTHRALTKIRVWPNIRRFKPGSNEQDLLRTPLQNRDGFRIFEISKSAVVCYFGIEDRMERAKRRVGLVNFVREKHSKLAKENRFGLSLTAGVFIAGAAAAMTVPCWIWAEQFKERMGGNLGEKVLNLAGELTDMYWELGISRDWIWL